MTQPHKETQPQLELPCEKLLREAAAWRLIGLLLECPRPGWHAEVAELSRQVEDAELRQAAAAAQHATAGMHHTTFGPGGPAAPREVSYRQTVDAGAFIAELLAYYHAFAFHHDSREPPDHVAIEAGFVGYLRLKEAFATNSADTANADVARQSAMTFIAEHLSLSAAPLASALANSGIEYLALAAAVLARRVGPPPASSSRAQVTLDDCAGCPELA